jgi:hypothetical protein
MNDKTNSPTAPLKTQAKALRQYLAEQDIELGHSKCLEAVARTRGYKNWDTASAVYSSTLPIGTVPEGVPYCVIMMRAEWSGDPMLHDPFDYFVRSFLHEDGEGVSGDPDAVKLHCALCVGEELPHALASRLVAICYSEEDLEAAWQPLQEAVKKIAPRRRVALGAIDGNRWKIAEESGSSGFDHRGPVERAYRRGVSQTLARLLRHWERTPPKMVVEEMRALLKTSQGLRYEDREIPLYLNVLLPERKVGAHTIEEIQKAIWEFADVHGRPPKSAEMPSAAQWLHRRGSSLGKEAAKKGE